MAPVVDKAGVLYSKLGHTKEERNCRHLHTKKELAEFSLTLGKTMLTFALPILSTAQLLGKPAPFSGLLVLTENTKYLC